MKEKVMIHRLIRDKEHEVDPSLEPGLRYAQLSRGDWSLSLLYEIQERSKDAVMRIGNGSAGEIQQRAVIDAADLFELVRSFGAAVGLEFTEILATANQRRAAMGGYEQRHAVMREVEVDG